MGHINTAMRTVVYGAVVVLAYLGFDRFDEAKQSHRRELVERDEQIEVLVGELDVSKARIVDLEVALKLLKVDQRVAHLDVVRQYEENGKTFTEVSFQEVGDGGRRLGVPRTTTIEGRTAYIDGLVIKFEDDFVEGGDALRGTSLVLFRRLFGESQAPSDGLELDTFGEQPSPYADDGSGEDPELVELWKRFWDYAHDPAAAAELGVRAMHGEAPYIEMRENGRYVVDLRASGGLTVRSREGER